jgi:membrane protease YdiL (CAAX protease family)
MSVTRSEQTSITPVSPPSSGLRGVIARRPITAFLVLVLALAYPLMALPILAFRGVIPGRGLLEMLPIAPDEVAGLLLTLGALLPATLVVTWSADGGAGVRRLFRRLTRWRIGMGWWVVIATALPALTTALAVLAGDSLQPVDVVPFFGTQLWLLLVNLVLVNVWEELAWSGFLQTHLERRHNVFVAALITIVPFALVHEPLRLFVGDVTAVSVAVGVGLYIVLGVFFRPMLAVVLRGTRDSVLAVAVLHTVFNRTNNDNGIAAGLVTGEARTLTMLVAVLAVTVAVSVVFRGRLSRAYRAELDAVPVTNINDRHPSR